MKKFTLFLTLFFAATMTIFAQDQEASLIATANPSGTVTTIWGEGDVTINFTKAVEYNAPDGGLKILNKDGIAVSNVTALMWNQEMTRAFVMLDTYITVTGTYYLTIPAGTFATADDEVLPETTFTFTVENNVVLNPEWWTDYDYASTVNEFQKITISFDNVTSLKLNLNKDTQPYIVTAAGNDEDGEVKIVETEDKDGKKQTKIEITFNKFTEEGKYEVYIPAGMFTMNESVNNDEKELKFTIVKPAEVTPLEIVSQGITPKINENGEFEEIAIVYNQPVYFGNPDNYWSVYVVYLTDSNGNKYPMWQKDPYNDDYTIQIIPSNTIVYIPVKLNESGYPYEYNANGKLSASPFAMEGEYTLNLADITVRYGRDENYDWHAGGSIEGTYTFDKNTATAIEDVEAEAEGTVIYDLTGRRINEITKAGIYIVNGVKKVIK